MSKKWWLIFIAVISVAVVVFIFGIILADTDSFLKSFLSSLSASMLILAIGILLIDGSIMTRKRKLDKVINIASRSIAQGNEEIAIILVREIGQYLTSILNLRINLYDEKRGDWNAFKSLLQGCFQAAKQFSNDSHLILHPIKTELELR